MSAVAEPTLLDTIARTVASTLKIPVDRLDVDAGFDSFGMDSIIAIELMTNLSKQLNVSITPAQLTAVNSIRELSGVIGGSMNEIPPAPVPKAQPTAAAQPAPAAATKASAGTAGGGAAPRRREEVRRQPRTDGARSDRPRTDRPRTDRAGGLGRMLAFVRDEYGLDLHGERFTSKQALIDHLLEHHADALSLYYGLSVDERSAEPAEVQAAALPTGSLGIAIVGMACTFADAKTPEALWHNLIEQRSLIAPLTGNRWGPAGVDAAPRWGALIEEVDRFDPAFFGFSEDEARLCDPQERLMMQALYHALQHAGLRADKLRGTRTGLFLGYEYAEYEHHLRRNLHRIPSAPALSSSSPIYYLANRISFLYDFKGPSEVVNASCASSGLAIHRACQSLALGECDVAICGGVSLNLFEGDYAAIARYGLLSPDGSCGVFDDAANGFTRGEGVGLLVLTRLNDAERDNRRIFAKVVATHQNNRGHASFISEIKHEAITQVIAECYEKHDIAPKSVRYIEVDGYATKWGDSFEFEGIKNAFAAPTAGEKHCALGSIKGNIGHVEPASGVASAIKVALSLYHKQFPATITKKALNTFIDIESRAHPLYIADRPLPFDELRRGDEPIRAGVNSFSDSGVNVHLLLEEYRSDNDRTQGDHLGPHLFILAARTSESLLQYLDDYVDYLQTSDEKIALRDLVYTQQISTEPMEQRLAVVASSHTELLQLLNRAKKQLTDKKPADGSNSIFIGSVQPRDNRRFDIIKAQISDEKLLENLRKGQLKDIALLWTSGIDMPWEDYWREFNLARRRHDEAASRIVDAPAYPFSKSRYWLEFDTSDAEAPGMVPSIEPQLSATLDETAKQNKSLGVAREWQFSTHLNDKERADDFDAEEKINLFISQETACLLSSPRDSIDEGKNFLELGFDSIGMATLIQKLIDLIGENISPSIVFKYQDIASLARYLASTYGEKIDRLYAVRIATAANDDTAANKKASTPTKNSDIESWFLNRDSIADGLIVPMQTQASGTPIFAVPGADGSVFSLQTLSKCMAGIRPLFAFEYVGVDGAREQLRTVSEIADAFINELSAIRDTSSVNLLGYSNGAVVAFEMARKLVEKQIKVERLVIVDQQCPVLKGRSEADDISAVFGNLIPSLGGDKPLDTDEFKRIPEAERAEYLFQLIISNGIVIPKEQFLATYAFSLINDKACRQFKPVRIKKAIDTIVVRAKHGMVTGSADMGWNKFLTKPAKCVEIDADHLTIVGKEASAQIAKLFQ